MGSIKVGETELLGGCLRDVIDEVVRDGVEKIIDGVGEIDAFGEDVVDDIAEVEVEVCGLDLGGVESEEVDFREEGGGFSGEEDEEGEDEGGNGEDDGDEDGESSHLWL